MEYDLSAHIVSTGHVDIRWMLLSPIANEIEIENVTNFDFQALAPAFQRTACHGCCIQLEIGSRGGIAIIHTFKFIPT